MSDDLDFSWITVPIRRRVAKDWPPPPRAEWPPPRPPGWVDDPNQEDCIWIHGTWYRDPSLKWPSSTDWQNWDGLHYYMLHDGTQPKVERMFNHTFDVGTIEPLAYVEGADGEVFLFSAEGRYYLWNDCKLTVHRLHFASPKEFLEHALMNEPHQMPDVVVQTRRPGARVGWTWRSRPRSR